MKNTSGKGPYEAKTSGDGIKTASGKAMDSTAAGTAAQIANGAMNYNSNDCAKYLKGSKKK